MLLLIPFAPAMFHMLGHEAPLVDMEATYLRIMIFGAILMLTKTTLSQFMLGIDRPMAVLNAALCGVGVNAVAAWVLINGRWGFPMLGIRGSAWGQNCGLFIEMTVLIAMSLRREVRATYGLASARFHLPAFMTLLKVGIPSGVQFASDVLAWSLFSVWVMAPFGTDTMAANTFTFRFYSVSFMPAYGLSTAVTALVGRYIGRGEPEAALERANLGFRFTSVYMLLCGIFFFVGRRWLLELFTQNPHILQIGSMMLIYAALYQFFDAMYIVYYGALRGAGDTLIPGMATAVLCWGVTVLGARGVARLYPQFGPAGPWAAATFYGIVLGSFMYARFSFGPWRKIRLGPTPVLAT
jgi:MATE family multidrug resistance protein